MCSLNWIFAVLPQGYTVWLRQQIWKGHLAIMAWCLVAVDNILQDSRNRGRCGDGNLISPVCDMSCSKVEINIALIAPSPSTIPVLDYQIEKKRNKCRINPWRCIVTSFENKVYPDQTTPAGVVWSGHTILSYILPKNKKMIIKLRCKHPARQQKSWILRRRKPYKYLRYELHRKLRLHQALQLFLTKCHV